MRVREGAGSLMVWETVPGRMLDSKPATNKDEMYVVLALFMLMGIIQKPTLQSYFSKIVFW